MGSDYHMQTIERWETINGVEVPIDRYGHYLDWTEIAHDRKTAQDLTTPYGILEYAVGNGEGDYCGDWMTCFDYERLPDGRYILHSTVNTESGGYIEDGEYNVVPEEAAVEVAKAMVANALEGVANNEVYHDAEGWNQSPCYFWRTIEARVRKSEGTPLGSEWGVAPRFPAAWKRWYVTKLWHDQPEGGSFGEIVRAPSHDEAEEALTRKMCQSLYEERDDDDTDEIDPMDEWITIDCWDVDEFIEHHAQPKSLTVPQLNSIAHGLAMTFNFGCATGGPGFITINGHSVTAERFAQLLKPLD